ncbi:MAG TPA: hypothetical protein V6D05_13445 [Stenomitos sp.]
MPVAPSDLCPKCGRDTLNTTKTIKFEIPDGETSLRMVLECTHCKRAVIREAPGTPNGQSDAVSP